MPFPHESTDTWNIINCSTHNNVKENNSGCVRP